MVSNKKYRIVFLGTIGIMILFLIFSYAASSHQNRQVENKFEKQAELPFEERKQIVPERDNVTVITGQGIQGIKAITAFSPDGRLLYYNNSNSGYADVDPSPEGKYTVLVSTAVDPNKTIKDKCSQECTRSLVQRINLTTGSVETVYSQIIPEFHSGSWHDVDRINDSHLLVAGTNRDRVFIVNTTNGIITWQWPAQSYYSMTTGAEFPKTWTHLNDVEYLDDGRIMVSIRNQQDVLFIEPQKGVVDKIGQDTLSKQHNPDYIPEENGGPAVVVAASHDDSIAEYQLSETGWEKTWEWSDRRMAWPRDADRLPDGHTLIVDTNGHRVLEINKSGSIVWSVDYYQPYDVERLGTGDESSGGPSATSLNLTSKMVSSNGQDGHDHIHESKSVWTRIKDFVKSTILPSRLKNAIQFVLPVWMDFEEVFAFVILVSAAIGWGIFEILVKGFNVELQKPVTITRKED